MDTETVVALAMGIFTLLLLILGLAIQIFTWGEQFACSHEWQPRMERCLKCRKERKIGRD